MASLNPAASSSGDWRHQLNPNARPRMCSTMLQTLRTYLPVQEVRRQNIANQIEKQCYIASANKSDYFKNIAAVIKHVEKHYQKYRHPGGSALHNTSGQSTATQSGIRHCPLNTVQQPVNQWQQHPEPSMYQQFYVQQIERTQQSLQQPVTVELSNLNQPTNLLNQHQTQVLSQPHQATSYNEDGIWQDLQPLLENFERDDTFSISEYLQDPDMTIGDEVVSNTVGVPLPPPQEHGCFDYTGLAAMEVPNSVLIADRPMNPKKRKCDGSSSAPVLR